MKFKYAYLLCCVMLCCVVLCCVVLCCVVLYCIVLCCLVSSRDVWHYIIQHYMKLWGIILIDYLFPELYNSNTFPSFPLSSIFIVSLIHSDIQNFQNYYIVLLNSLTYFIHFILFYFIFLSFTFNFTSADFDFYSEIRKSFNSLSPRFRSSTVIISLISLCWYIWFQFFE